MPHNDHTWEQITAAARLMELRFTVNHQHGWVEFHWDTLDEYRALYRLAKTYDLFNTEHMLANQKAGRVKAWIPVLFNKYSGDLTTRSNS